MTRTGGIALLLLVGLWLWPIGPADAAKTVAVRTPGMKDTGVKPDITVPYLTTGYSTFMNGVVAPRIYASPTVDDPRYPGSTPVFNLPFWGGGIQGFGDRSNGAKLRHWSSPGGLGPR
jgi:hypothetical protein